MSRHGGGSGRQWWRLPYLGDLHSLHDGVRIHPAISEGVVNDVVHFPPLPRCLEEFKPEVATHGVVVFALLDGGLESLCVR